MKKQNLSLSSQYNPLFQPFPQREKGVTTNVFFPSTRGGGIKGGGCKAFTLVELIVVITILAILGTIAFISLQGYSADARDTKRISDVRSILTKINVENIVGTPLERLITETKDEYEQILGKTGSLINTMGKADFINLDENPDDFKDPIDNEDYYFAYAIGETGSGRYNFIEGMTITETQGIKISGNYYTTMPGDVPSLFVEGGKYYEEGSTPPVFEYEDMACSEGYTNSTTFMSNATGPCVQHFPNERVIAVADGNGGGYIMGDRNLGARAVYNGEIESSRSYDANPDSNSNTPLIKTPLAYWGNFYQWGRNDTGYTDDDDFAINSDWQPRNDNAWGGELDTETTTDTTTIGNGLLRQGPCPSNYHVPSIQEWDTLIRLYFEYKQEPCIGDTCAFGGEEEFADFQNELKLPRTGFYLGDFAFYGDTGFYRTSSPYGTEAYTLLFYADEVNTRHNNFRMMALPIRCFKN